MHLHKLAQVFGRESVTARVCSFLLCLPTPQGYRCAFVPMANKKKINSFREKHISNKQKINSFSPGEEITLVPNEQTDTITPR